MGAFFDLEVTLNKKHFSCFLILKFVKNKLFVFMAYPAPEILHFMFDVCFSRWLRVCGHFGCHRRDDHPI